MAATLTYNATDARGRRKRYDALRAKLRSDRSTFDAHWTDLATYLQPRRTRFFAQDRNKGGARNEKILDNTALLAMRTLKSGMHAGLTSPARPWFKLTTSSPKLNARADIKAWLYEVEQIIGGVFLQSNLYNSLPIVYGDMGVFGTAAMAVLEDGDKTIRTYTYPVGSYWLGTDERGIVNTFIRDYEMTVRQVVKKYGTQPNGEIDWTHLSMAVRGAWENGRYEDAVPVTWCVTPNEDYEPGKIGPVGMRFASCTWETNNEAGQLLREAGFKTFPIMAPRWDITGEDNYGTDCPGMTVLPDVKQLQIMQRKKAQAIGKMVDPALTGPTALRTQKTSLVSGEITYVDVRDGMGGLRPIHEVNLNLQHLTFDVGQVQNRIDRGCYADLFLMLQHDDARGAQPITAEEVRERHEEKLLALGPVLERTNDELLDPLIDRTYQICFDLGKLPEPPEDLDGVDLQVEYISIMAQAQKLVAVVGLDRFMSTTTQLAEVYPEVPQKVDIFEVIDRYIDLLGVDPRIARDNAAAQERVDTLQQAAAQAQQAVQAKDMSAAVKNAATSPMDGDTALARLVQGVQGAAAGGV